MTLGSYTALDLPCIPSPPSIDSLKWTESGQILYLSKYAVYILTPSHIGIRTTDNTKDILDCFQTMIQIDRSSEAAQKWSELNYKWGAASLGSVDISLKAMACSPGNITKNGGCVLVLLTSNMDVSLWASTNNALKKEWAKIHDVTPYLHQIHAHKARTAIADPTIQAQVTSIFWSSQPQFDVSPSSGLDASVLITGTRAGSLVFLRFDASTSTTQVLGAVSAADKWITHLALSPWRLSEERKSCEADLAFGTSDGSVGLVCIKQTLRNTGLFTVFGPELTIELSFTTPREVFAGISNALTALQWITTESKNNVLVKCRAGVLDFWTEPSSVSASGWMGYISLPLQRNSSSLGSSRFHAVSGLYYVRSMDCLVVSLSDGSFHVVYEMTTSPSWNCSGPRHNLTNEEITQACRAVFFNVEDGRLSLRDMSRTNGLVAIADSGRIFWTQESVRPTDFSYKYDKAQRATLITARLWQLPQQEYLLQEITETLNTPKSCSGATTQHLLRQAFIVVAENPDLHPQLVELLLPRSIEFSLPVFAPWSADFGPILRSSFRQSVTRYLFGSDALVGLRMRLYLAEVIGKHGSSATNRIAHQIACQLLQAISQMLLRVMLRLITPIVQHISDGDAPFVLRIIQCASPPDCPPDLRQEAQALLDALCLHLRTLGPKEAVQALIESCPACGSSIMFDGATSPVCSEGHEWERCSVSSFLLVDEVQTCVGCRRKAYLPVSAGGCLPLIAQGWLVEDLLEAIKRCLFCGNGFTLGS